MIGSLRYEWRRITSIRATWILLGSSVIIAVAFAFLIAWGTDQLRIATESDAQSAPFEMINLSSVINQSAANFIGLVILGTVAAQAFGQDYRHGTIRLTLTAFPRRVYIFVSKILVCGLWITIAFLVALVLATVILKPHTDLFSSDLSATGFVAFFGRSWLYLMGFCLIVFAVTVLTRVLSLGVIVPVVVALVFEPLVNGFLSGPLPWVTKILPFTAGVQFADGTDVVRSGLVFLAWVVVLIGAAFAVFKVRDA
ncbi:MAG: ABC transporter permease [Actinomycetes bacterium]